MKANARNAFTIHGATSVIPTITKWNVQGLRRNIMKGTYEITLTSSVGIHREAVWASSLRVAIQYANDQANAYGCRYEVERKSFMKHTKIKTLKGD
ncbi:MAG: hypothetical protein DRQ46_09965 [Gammaproteobacteria bacterium]|nr:MAG: hypothetical protein DRQ46_09965 [Gammaproteobacteria bacterium]